jgi:hypothetical protein
MDTSVSSLILRWRILRLFSGLWLTVTVFSVTLILPPTLITFGLTVMTFSVLTAGIAVLTYKPKMALISILAAFTLFFTLLHMEIALRTFQSNLPLILLDFVMLLFAVENLTAMSRQPFFEVGERDCQIPVSLIGRFVEHAFRRSLRMALLFASSYMISLAAVYFSAYVSILQPGLAEISLYVIIVSLSLALLTLVQED